MIMIKNIIGGIIVLFGVITICLNYAYIGMSQINRKKGIDRHHSTIPFLGSLTTLIGLVILPVKTNIFIVFLVLFIDPGTLSLIISIPYLL